MLLYFSLTLSIKTFYNMLYVITFFLRFDTFTVLE